ncbi:MAG TPA: biotin--[acetyl-CoA-carboxylase] ligase [Pyrinomonadaceae bacterium]|jgi:BirA family biotin operon repressor/biotin-[acetyl-CoA-carboxylase] ligase|nr:biotin--[acetyl-CoA-carboxylase] ligase [Pyrinomonadaceae bacterium]
MAEFVPQILRFESLPSTNLEAARQAVAGAAEGVCIIAGEQTAGRGRLQRHWVSPKNAGLYFSIIMRPQFEQTFWPLLTLMAAVAVHDALRDACALETDIKWPNDILANDKKLCGILAETVETPLGRAVIVGIGINLMTSSLPPELETHATSVEAACKQKPDAERVLAALVRALASRYEMLNQAGGSEQIIREWRARSSYSEGKLIRVSDSSDSLVGTTRGLERDGALRVETVGGEIRIVRAGDVTAIRAISV